jgi:hypothetical protein
MEKQRILIFSFRNEIDYGTELVPVSFRNSLVRKATKAAKESESPTGSDQFPNF